MLPCSSLTARCLLHYCAGDALSCCWVDSRVPNCTQGGEVRGGPARQLRAKRGQPHHQHVPPFVVTPGHHRLSLSAHRTLSRAACRSVVWPNAPSAARLTGALAAQHVPRLVLVQEPVPGMPCCVTCCTPYHRTVAELSFIQLPRNLLHDPPAVITSPLSCVSQPSCATSCCTRSPSSYHVSARWPHQQRPCIDTAPACHPCHHQPMTPSPPPSSSPQLDHAVRQRLAQPLHQLQRLHHLPAAAVQALHRQLPQLSQPTQLGQLLLQHCHLSIRHVQLEIRQARQGPQPLHHARKQRHGRLCQLSHQGHHELPCAAYMPQPATLSHPDAQAAVHHLLVLISSSICSRSERMFLTARSCAGFHAQPDTCTAATAAAPALHAQAHALLVTQRQVMLASPAGSIGHRSGSKCLCTAAAIVPPAWPHLVCNLLEVCLLQCLVKSLQAAYSSGAGGQLRDNWGVAGCTHSQPSPGVHLDCSANEQQHCPYPRATWDDYGLLAFRQHCRRHGWAQPKPLEGPGCKLESA
jgi:hypothetical protein